MVIGYIGNFDKIYDEEGIALALEKLGASIIRIPYKDISLNPKLVEEHIKNSQLNFLMSPKWSISNPAYTFKLCSQNNVKTITYHPDLFYSLSNNQSYFPLVNGESTLGSRHNQATNIPRSIIYGTDFVFTPEGNAHEYYKNNGINHHVIRQGIHNGCCYPGFPKYKKHDIIFIGGVNNPTHSYRQGLINFLKETYKDRFIHVGENSEEFRMDDLNDLIASCKIVIGESVPAPHYWSNRLYETIGRKGFCLHAYTEGIDQEYTIKEHFDVFYREQGFGSLQTKLDYWIKNNDLREEVATKGMLHTQKYHTLTNRAAQILEILINYENNK